MSLGLVLGQDHGRAGMVDLTKAVVVLPSSATPIEMQAAVMLVEEVEKRAHVRWERTNALPSSASAVVVLGSVETLRHAGDGLASRVPLAKNAISQASDGFQIGVQTTPFPLVFIAGNDPRGSLFGVGRLLRELILERGVAQLRDDFAISTAPRTALRGHQLGYRPKTNSYDAWDVEQWEQYIRDLIIFGCNAIELIPPRSDDASDSAHFPRRPLDMMIAMSGLAAKYGLDVWVWYPAMDKDYGDEATLQFALQEWGLVLEKLPKLNAVFVPGGDPGHTPPHQLLELLKRQIASLHQYHPRAEMWVSPQSFNRAWMDEFLSLLQKEPPQWLTGLVYGPQVRLSLPDLRALVPRQFPIRHYPDITHTRQCQYPVPDWDVAFAVTEARECINPRPMDEAILFRATQHDTIGFITYSEGCNDDVNKAVWSALGWDPDVAVIDILRQYSRCYISHSGAEGFAQGLLGLERNWRGPLLANNDVEVTWQQFRDLERSATPERLKNWRFQQGLFRSYYDVYVRRRLLAETLLENEALDRLRRADVTGSLTAMDEAEQILDRALKTSVAPDIRDRILELGAALFQSIGMQLSVHKYGAIAVDRGAALDTLDFPLNNRLWLKEQFRRIRSVSFEPQRLSALQQVIAWENPGPGGFYDDLGNSARQAHLVRGPGLDQDPGCFRSPRSGFEEDLVLDDDDPPPQGNRRVSWLDHAETLYDAPLRLRYTGLEKDATYLVRVTYAGDNPKRQISLTANDVIQIHPLLSKPMPFRPLEFKLPHSATESGTLTLSWTGEPGLGGNGRGCQVSEVWLIRSSP